MSCYYPIPNDYRLNIGNKEIIRSSITLINYPSNLLLDSLSILKKRDIYYSLYTIQNSEWVKVSDTLCSFGQTIEFKRQSIDIPEDDFAVIVPSFNTNNPDKTRFLPDPISLRVDKAKVTERCSYNFKLNESMGSYLGDFPAGMSKLKRSTFLTFDSLRGDISSKAESLMLLMNITNDAEDKSVHSIKFFNPESNEIIQDSKSSSNSFDSFSLPKAKSDISKNVNISITCKTSVFVPIFLNAQINDNFSEISVEHTHPPNTIFWNSGSIGTRTYKRSWLNKCK